MTLGGDSASALDRMKIKDEEDEEENRVSESSLVAIVNSAINLFSTI